MAIKINAGNTNKADVAQRTEQGSSKAKVAGSSPAVSAKGREWPDEVEAITASQLMPEEISALRKSLSMMQSQTGTNLVPLREIIQKHKDRLAYNAAYQRDLRTIKRLNLNCTVKAYRESLK